jgi:hypothetical protein
MTVVRQLVTERGRASGGKHTEPPTCADVGSMPFKTVAVQILGVMWAVAALIFDHPYDAAVRVPGGAILRVWGRAAGIQPDAVDTAALGPLR